MFNLIYDPVTLYNKYNSTLITGSEAEKLEKMLQKKYKKHLSFEDNGLTVYSKTENKIELSKGCQACKHGKWLCLFVGYNCNLQCNFCPQPKQSNFVNVFEDINLTSHGTIQELQYYLSVDKTIEGVSYSGGEPLLYFDKIISLASFINKNCSPIYQWIYTNGTLLDEKKLKELQKVGINEIRFDLSATNFSEEIIEKISLTNKYIDRITVEIPAIPQIRSLINNNLLDKLVDLGVKQLNISELTLTQEVNMEHYGRNTVLVAHKGFYKGLSLLESKFIYYEILEYAAEKKLNILINNCNSNSKFVQLANKQLNQKLYKN